MKRLAIIVGVAGALVASAASAAYPAAIDRTAPYTMSPGDTIVLTGSVRTSLDGTVIDALVATNENPKLIDGAQRGGLYDFEAGGFRVVEQHPETHTYTLAATGQPGVACSAAHVASPCLVPRLSSLAHERLVTEEDLARSMSGGIDVRYVAAPVPEAPPKPAISAEGAQGLAGAGAGLAVTAAIAAAFAARARRRSAMGQVRSAARQAMRETKGDATLAGVGAQIDDLVARAQKLEQARRACANKLAKIDVVGLEKKRAAWASSQAAEAQEALTWLTAESAEAARLASDLSSSVAGLERIASALRILALRARSHRGTRARAAKADPVDALAAELDLRDRAMAEADEV